MAQVAGAEPEGPSALNWSPDIRLMPRPTCQRTYDLSPKPCQ